MAELEAPAPATVKRVTPRERDLLQLVLLGMKPTDAMRQLEPSSRRPDVMASKILAKPHVKAERQRLEDDALATAGVTRTWIANELRKIGNAKLFHADGRLKGIEELDEDTRDAVASVEFDEDLEEVGSQLPLVDSDGRPLIDRAVRKRNVKLKLWNKADALKELATLARMKESDPLTGLERVGPGLTVIVQQAVQLQGPNGAATASKPGPLHYVPVRLPPPR